MIRYVSLMRNRIVAPLIVSVGTVLLIAISVWASFSIESQRERVMRHVAMGTDRLGNTIRLETHYAIK